VRTYLASLGEFARKVTHHVYAFVVGVVGGILGLASLVYAVVQPNVKTPLVPLWIWLPLLSGGFLLATFRAFHDVRMERDVERNEIERRFSTMRYALQRTGIDYHLDLCLEDHTLSVGVGLKLTNNSNEYLRYEIEHMIVIIESKSVQSPHFYNRGIIIAPHGTDLFRYPFITGVPEDWQAGFIEFTVRYGHPSAPLRYRKSQELSLRVSRFLNQPPPGNIRIDADLIHDPDVEELSTLEQMPGCSRSTASLPSANAEHATSIKRISWRRNTRPDPAHTSSRPTPSAGPLRNT
jgi:hypothetical protein